MSSIKDDAATLLNEFQKDPTHTSYCEYTWRGRFAAQSDCNCGAVRNQRDEWLELAEALARKIVDIPAEQFEAGAP